MLFRIDLDRYLTHMIDHFPRDILLSMQYAIVSAGIRNMGRFVNCVKINELYPSSETTTSYYQSKDEKVLRKMYTDELAESKFLLYTAFVNNVLHHNDIVIVSREIENIYIDILVDYLYDNYNVPCINLNELFTKDRVGPFTLDRQAIQDSAVDIRRDAGKSMIASMESTEDGRLQLLEKMSRKQKIKKLAKLGIDVNSSDYNELDNLLIEEWVSPSDGAI